MFSDLEKTIKQITQEDISLRPTTTKSATIMFLKVSHQTQLLPHTFWGSRLIHTKDKELLKVTKSTIID